MPLTALISLVVACFFLWLINGPVSITGRVKMPINVVVSLIIVGTGLLLINTYVPMAGSIKAILNIVVVVATCVGVLQALGLWDSVLRIWSHLTSHHAPQ